MRIIRTVLLLSMVLCSRFAIAQETSPELTAIAHDDSTQLAKVLTKENIAACYGNYSLLSQTVRTNAVRCFAFLIARGADVNKICDGYVPPLMHAAKYGRLDMIKVLVAKGADVHFKYQGSYQPANGETPLTYAEKYQQKEVADYLRSLNK